MSHTQRRSRHIRPTYGRKQTAVQNNTIRGAQSDVADCAMISYAETHHQRDKCDYMGRAQVLDEQKYSRVLGLYVRVKLEVDGSGSSPDTRRCSYSFFARDRLMLFDRTM